MKRFFFDFIRVFSLFLLSLTAALIVFVSGSTLYIYLTDAAASSQGLAFWMRDVVVLVMFVFGMLLLIVAWRLWRGNGSAYPLALRVLSGALILPLLDWVWIFWQGQVLFGMASLSLPLLITWLVFVSFKWPALGKNIVFDRINTSSDDLSRLDDWKA